MYHSRHHDPFASFGPHQGSSLRSHARSQWGFEPDAAMETEPVEPSRAGPSQRRFSFFIVLALAVCLVLFGRFASLQMVQGADLRVAAEENRLRLIPVKAARGIIYDRHGTALVRNVPNLAVHVVPSDLPADSTLVRVAEQLASLLGEPVETVATELTELRTHSVRASLLREHLSYDTARAIKLVERELPGIQVVETATREYIGSQAFSHILGYTGKITQEEYDAGGDYLLTDYIGKTGIERSFESVLRGQDGRKSVEVDALGKEQRVVASEDPHMGSSVYLSVDAALQAYAQERLDATVSRSGKQGGAVVAIDPRNGEVLALVSAPAYDNNIFVRDEPGDAFAQLLADERNPLFNRAIAGQYPSGSTIKPFIAAAALQEGVINERTTVVSTGGIAIDRWFFPDWKAGGHGVTDVRKAIAESVNSFFYTIGGGTDTFTGLGVDRITSYLTNFGFGRTSDIDLENEASGFLPSRAWKEAVKRERWYIGDTYHLSIGQGDILVTPLQLAVGTAAIANRGTVFHPRLVTTMTNEDTAIGRQETTPNVARAGFIDERHLQVVREGMRQAVLSGSAQRLQSLPVSAAAKTGTAQFGTSDVTHSWFTAFAPYENPEIAIAVLVEKGGDGTAAALPLAQEILTWYFSDR